MKTNNINTIKPVLKWAGGKRQLLDQIEKYMPSKYKRYFEPFFGGGALFFDLLPNDAVINDYNVELMNVYSVIKSNPKGLIKQLKYHKSRHSEEYYYEIRNKDRSNRYSKMSDTSKASRIVYLNRTCFNGLYRVNKNGFYNTPLGKYINPKIVDEDNILNISDYLNSNNISILCGDYQEAIKEAKKGDFVYLDPPYDPLTKTSSFTDYTNVGFSRDDQKRLKELCDHLNEKGVLFLQSNSNTEYIRDLYKDYNVTIVNANRSINSDGKNRKDASEVLIYNYKIGD